MEFIPLKKPKAKGTAVKEQKVGETRKNFKKDENKVVSRENLKKTQPRYQKKKVKNKYAVKNLGAKKNVPTKKVTNDDDEEEENDDAQPAEKMEENISDVEDEKDDNEQEEESEEESDVEDDEDDDDDGEDDDDENKLKKALQKKRMELDEKKKNRLFINFRKKIHSDKQIKELHPNIKSVILPRKKKSKWCWAVFESQEKANNAFKKLRKIKGVIVSKPNPREKVEIKLEKKMKTVLRKQEAKKKLQQQWA